MRLLEALSQSWYVVTIALVLLVRVDRLNRNHALNHIVRLSPERVVSRIFAGPLVRYTPVIRNCILSHESSLLWICLCDLVSPIQRIVGRDALPPPNLFPVLR